MLYRLLYWLDLAFGTALMIALAGVLASLWPADAAQAAPVTVTRPVGTFDAIASAGNWELFVHAGSPTAVSITAEPEDVAADDLAADDVTVRIAGSGDVAVHARKTLDATIAGSGDVVYRGNPVVQRRIAGTGTVAARR